MENSIDQEVKAVYTEGNYVNEFINYYQKEVIEKSDTSLRQTKSR